MNILKEKRPVERRAVHPPVDIFITEKEFILEAEMPGLDRSTLSVELRGDRLQVSGVRRQPDERTAGARYELEYHRVFELNSEIDRNKIQAAYENGVLRVTLAKAEQTQPKKIEILG